MTKNEKKTENLARKLFTEVGIFGNDSFLVEEQKSDNPVIQKLLKSASKSGTGLGKPEFIIRKKDDNDFLLVIECKADTKFHESKNRDIYKDYAVDGALLYGGNLAREFNVIAIGISGEDEEDVVISTFLFPKNSSNYSDLLDENSQKVRRILTWERYIDRAKFDPALAKARHTDLMKFSRDLHDYMRDYAKVTEAQKPLLVSGVLLALMDRGFEVAYKKYEGEELASETFNAIKKIIDKAELGDTHEAKKKAVVNAFSFIAHHPELQKIDPKKNESPLLHIIQDLHVHVQPFTKEHYDFDIIGNFYGEFIRYTGGDGKGLGIVLTPKHITELFSDLAKLDKNSVVLDICAGTGGFLISAMKKMTEKVSADEKKHILSNSLIGIEQEPSMFALAVSNMILRGDGKTNLHQGSCFDDGIFNKIKGKATAGFVNPPYSQKGDKLHELDFVIRMLDGLAKNAMGIAIVPFEVATNTKNDLRRKLLSEHRLEAVMSMPADLFYPIGTVTCIMVFTAHTPHEGDQTHESWFGYWRDDGFRKAKHEGRIPTARWLEIKKDWELMFRKKEVPGKAVWKRVGVDDEWCAEAYLQTDYTSVPDLDFIENIKKYLAFKFLSSGNTINANSANSEKIQLNPEKWKWFAYKDIFDIKKGKRLTKEDMEQGETPFIGSSEYNNGVTALISEDPIHKKNTITVAYDGSVGESFYQAEDFYALDSVNVLYPKFDLNPYIAMFLITLIRKEQYRFSYGRKWKLDRMNESKIKLPVLEDDIPDWQFMENYIKSLPYSVNL